MFNKYYQDELTYLRELGREPKRGFVHEHDRWPRHVQALKLQDALLTTREKAGG